VRPKTDSPIAELQQQFVRLRITNMAEVDVGLFDFDFNTTFSLFVINHEKNVYLRYGARTDEGADVMLSEPSLIKALQRGIAIHQQWKGGDLDLPAPPQPLPAQSFPNVRNVVKKKQCVHCHQVGEGRALELIALKNFDKKTMPWVYPDPAKLGLIIDPDDGVLLSKTEGSAAAAGIKPGETITRIGDQMAHTFADVQHALHHLPYDATSVTITTNRAARQLALPAYWRVTDINRRSVGHRMTPFPEFWGKTMSDSEKKELGLDPIGFATRVTKFWTNTNGKKAGMRQGDIVFSVDGKTNSPLAKNAMIYIRTHFETGDEVELKFLRGKEKRSAKVKLRAKPW
jgi:serine protease Do